jgi:hypothetical protein
MKLSDCSVSAMGWDLLDQCRVQETSLRSTCAAVLQLGASSSFEELLAAREAADRRVRATGTGYQAAGLQADAQAPGSAYENHENKCTVVICDAM